MARLRKRGFRRLELDLEEQRRYEESALDVYFVMKDGCGADAGTRDPRQKSNSCVSFPNRN